MSATYWIARYVPDTFRNEPRNVGVIVAVNGVVAARFLGEREDGSFDGRKIKGFSHPLVYAQWRTYWRSKLTVPNLERISRKTGPNYYLALGGEVTDTGADNAGEVCAFLFDLLVGGGPVDAFGWHTIEDTEADLETDIAAALENEHIIAGDSEIFVRYPVVKNAEVPGRIATHTPSFVQRNGALNVYEHIDFNKTKANKTRDRAGWMAYMFKDIREREAGTRAFSLIRPEHGGGATQIEYARTVLGNESQMVNWADENERGRFLAERRQIADPLGVIIEVRGPRAPD